jgi:glc operon protein GlcG
MSPVLLAALLAASPASAALVEAATTESPVSYFAADSVAASFARGGVLLVDRNYMIHTSRRVEPGKVEVHEQDTDLIYVLDGSATFVTGGTLRDGQAIAPGEIRGTQLDGGTTRTLVKGDVIVVPNGTPHWFRAVQGPFFYYTVKVR